MSTGTGVYHSDMDWTEAQPEAPEEFDMSQFETHEERLWEHNSDQLEGSEGSRFDPNDLVPDYWEEEDPPYDREY